MALGPEMRLTARENETLERCEYEIDKWIREHYKNEQSVTINTSLEVFEFTNKVAFKLTQRYKTAGWAKITFHMDASNRYFAILVR